ncbi:hypothetical protein QZH41_008783 [Actinostola sp. cb2023]|nr:hypothetical protein QZH41_008783 [Actinostola sp. cb2023]
MAAGGEVVAKYVGHKIAKTRWSPLQQGSIATTDIFATGGWDDETNKLCLWKIESSDHSPTEKSVLPNEPFLICEKEHIGDVCDLQFLDRERILAASSTGTVTLHYFHAKKKSLLLHQSWDTLHYLGDRGTACTCLAVNRITADVATAGEDGRINLLVLDQSHPVRTIDSADSTTINGITYSAANEVIAVTMSGQVKSWDVRQATNRPTKTMILSGDRVPLLCIDKHPTQPHLLATGSQDGVLSIWDVRQEHYPVTLLEGHSAELWEVKFHPQKPNHLFSCSEDGSLWQWDGTSMAATSFAPNQSFKPTLPTAHLTNGIDTPGSVVSPWLSVDATKHRMETYSLLSENRLSINSLDIESQHLLCGCDCEAIFVICDLILR